MNFVVAELLDGWDEIIKMSNGGIRSKALTFVWEKEKETYAKREQKPTLSYACVFVTWNFMNCLRLPIGNKQANKVYI